MAIVQRVVAQIRYQGRFPCKTGFDALNLSYRENLTEGHPLTFLLFLTPTARLVVGQEWLFLCANEGVVTPYWQLQQPAGGFGDEVGQ